MSFSRPKLYCNIEYLAAVYIFVYIFIMKYSVCMLVSPFCRDDYSSKLHDRNKWVLKVESAIFWYLRNNQKWTQIRNVPPTTEILPLILSILMRIICSLCVLYVFKNYVSDCHWSISNLFRKFSDYENHFL